MIGWCRPAFLVVAVLLVIALAAAALTQVAEDQASALLVWRTVDLCTLHSTCTVQ